MIVLPAMAGGEVCSVGRKFARRDAKPAPEIDNAVVAEALDGMAGAGVDGDQTAIDGGEKDAALARSRDPQGNAAVGEVSITGVFLHFGVVSPLELAGRGIEREDAAERRRQIESAIDIQGRGFEGGGAATRGRIGIAGAVGPGDFELRDVGASDLLEGRKALAAGVVAVVVPFAYRRISEAKKQWGDNRKQTNR